MYELQNLRDVFNSQALEVKETRDIQRFLLYFAEILQIAIENSLISKDDQVSISGFISTAIENQIVVDEEDEFADTSVPISNSFYVFALWMSNRSNWENWSDLREINSVHTASELIKQSATWFYKQLDTIEKTLSFASDIYLKCQMYQKMLKSFNETLKGLRAYNSLYTNMCIVDYHYVTFPGLDIYAFIGNTSTRNANCFESLKLQVEYFVIETNILNKVDAESIFEKKNKEANDCKNETLKESQLLNAEMQKKLKLRQQKFDNDKLSKSNDIVELRREYENDIAKLNQEWSAKEQKLEEKELKSLDATLAVHSDFYTLYDFIAEYALYALYKSGKEAYPSTPEERGKRIEELGFNQSIILFLNDFRNILNEMEINYLLSHLS